MWAIWVSTTGQMWIMNSATFYDRTGNLHTKKAPWWWRRSGKFFCAKINWRIFINPWGIYKPLIIQCGPPSDVCWFINPSNYSYLRTINHSEIGAMFTNLAFVNGGLTSYHPNIFQIGRKLSPFKCQLDIFSSPVLCFICFGRS